MNTKKHFRNLIIYIIFLVAVMGVIFYFSSENSQLSNDSSGSFSKLILRIISPILPQCITDFIRLYIRKIAHFTLYFALGSFSLLTVKELYILKKPENSASFTMYIYAFIFCIMYAASDELHQYFVAGRSCKITDVLLDCAGSLSAILIICIITLIAHRHKKSATQ